MKRSGKSVYTAAILVFSLGFVGGVYAHGGVSIQDDMCVMKIGAAYEAHFTGYQPKFRAGQEFCEDVPIVGDTVFVLDFLTTALRSMDVSFTILEDYTGKGLKTTYDDLGTNEQMKEATLLTTPGRQYSQGTLVVEQTFDHPGMFIGLVEATDSKGAVYRSVFPFRVGIAQWGQQVRSAVMPIVLVGGILGFFAWRVSRDQRRRAQKKAQAT